MSAFKAAGVETVFEHIIIGFKQVLRKVGIEGHGPHYKVAKYRHDTGRNLPAVYRVKLTIELEELATGETESFWQEFVKEKEDEGNTDEE